jgi:ligand-binding sensor domain-containing protein
VLASSTSHAVPAAVASTVSPAGVWSVFTNANSVNALAIDPGSGDLWAGTSGGVVHWIGATGQYTKYTTADGLANNAVTTVAIDAATGDRWFGIGGGGVSRLGAVGRWRTFTIADGLADNAVEAVAVDPATGDKWFGTDDGAARLSRAYSVFLPWVARAAER